MKLLEDQGFDLFVDQWNEMNLYHGRDGKRAVPSDYLFGSARYNLPTDEEKLIAGAKSVLNDAIHSNNFDYEAFKRRAMDVIAIEKQLSERMKKRWLSV